MGVRLWILAMVWMPLPAIALPSDRQLQDFAKELCAINSPSPQQFEAAVSQQINRWISDQSLTEADLKTPNSAEALGAQLAGFLIQQCPQQASKLFGI
ncbi:hypothetical protein [Synechococcus elongatus]|uniref:DUF732 domain-containing protein n=2 Tax=Synechococcus elongatus TaxID=32046 RepID=A0AAN1QQ55_SYNEL|nr:hypothetical protein [Synechococcus elongatus]AZB73437.1 hypothetical protein DOP62_12615 [Synechococcus elongatus PCC 11801]QFZ93098.1 hypothetical protein EKO22_12955 [Synechococcus elongatus PCC 11802]